MSLVLVCVILCLCYRNYKLQQKKFDLLSQTNQQLLIKIARLQETNKQLTISEQELKKINLTKDKFFSIIAHDLKGPLNSLTGLLQLLIKYADSFSKEELKDFGKNMNKSVNNLLDLLENLLRWSQAQSGTIEYCPEEINLLELADSTIHLLAPSAASKDISISLNIHKHLAVFADKNMVSFTIRNLLSNAIKFTRNGGTVSVYASATNEQVEISIADTGIGMSEQDLAKLFKIDKCYTTNGTANEIGTGLGLILCNEFIEKNQGKITVESSLNEGTIFRFYLPVVTVGEQVPEMDVY
jgi:signal transduction histidine kinase